VFDLDLNNVGVAGGEMTVLMKRKAGVAPIMSDASSARAAARVALTRLPAPVHQLREKAAVLLAKTLKALFDGADDALFDLADRATNNQDQNVYFDAMREVRLRRRVIESDFHLKLDQGYAALLGGGESQSASELAVDELTLVGNDQLEFQVAVDAMVARALGHCAESVQHIALRLDSLVPIKVYQQNNPVGPDCLCHAFLSVIEPLDIDIKAKLVLLKLFEKAVVAQLSKVYSLLNNLLIQQNVLPSLARQATAPKRVAGSGASSAPIQGKTGQERMGQGQVSSDTQVWNQLRALLTEESSPQGDLMVPSGAGAESLKQVASTLNGTQLLQLLNRVQRESLGAKAASVLPEQLVGQRTSGGDHDVINLVNMLFEFILDDRNLSSTMKALLARLQIPIIKVAIVDKDFFNRAGHPARRLLNELATAALGWQAPENPDTRDPLLAHIEKLVQRVLSDFDTDLGIFDELLADFLAFNDKERRRALILERRTLDAESGKAKAEQGREQVDSLLKKLINGRSLPDVVNQILSGPWSNVLFLHGLKDGVDSQPWLSACDVADDLIWSVTEEVSVDSRQRLLALIPELLNRLRSGFESIAFNPFEVNELLRQLEPIHLSRLTLTSVPVPKPKPKQVEAASVKDKQVKRASEPAHTKRETVERATPVVDRAAVPNTPLDVVKSENDTPSVEELNASSPEPDPVSEQSLQQVDGLVPGCWFEVSDAQNNHNRCRLAAVIKSVDKYIFVNRDGMKASECNRYGLAQALEAGRFRLLDDGMLFDRALEAVIGDLRKSRVR